MAYIKDDNFYSIFGWMINKLDLKGLELSVYSIIYAFSQDGESSFHGSLQYLADFTNSSKRGVINALQGLVDKGLIAKNDVINNGVKFCEYYVTKFIGGEESAWGSEKSSLGYCTKFTRGSEKSATNNIYNNINDNINNNIEITKPSRKKFRKPTLEELIAYCKDKGFENVDAQYFLDYYESKGWKVGNSPMKDWKCAVNNWHKRDYPNKKANKPYGTSLCSQTCDVVTDEDLKNIRF